MERRPEAFGAADHQGVGWADEVPVHIIEGQIYRNAEQVPNQRMPERFDMAHRPFPLPAESIKDCALIPAASKMNSRHRPYFDLSQSSPCFRPSLPATEYRAPGALRVAWNCSSVSPRMAA